MKQRILARSLFFALVLGAIAIPGAAIAYSLGRTARVAAPFDALCGVPLEQDFPCRALHIIDGEPAVARFQCGKQGVDLAAVSVYRGPDEYATVYTLLSPGPFEPLYARSAYTAAPWRSMTLWLPRSWETEQGTATPVSAMTAVGAGALSVLHSNHSFLCREERKTWAAFPTSLSPEQAMQLLKEAHIPFP